MTFPVTFSASRLEQRARARGVTLNRAKDPVLVTLYHETLQGIRNEVNQERMHELARNETFLIALERDVGEIVTKLNELARKQEYRVFMKISQRLRKAKGELAVALMLFDDREEAEAVKRIRGRVTALGNFGQLLENILLYWPTT